jgi:hypothetical protein
MALQPHQIDAGGFRAELYAGIKERRDNSDCENVADINVDHWFTPLLNPNIRPAFRCRSIGRG